MPSTTKSSKSTKTSKKSKKMTKSTTQPVVESAPDQAPAPEPGINDTSKVIQESSDVKSEITEPSVDDVLELIDADISSIFTLFKNVRVNRRLLTRGIQRERRATNRRKHRGGSDPNKPKKKPSGFAKPTKLSPELEVFLSVDKDTLLARTDVTKRITTYIREHDLQNPKNRREIRPDTKLLNLLNMPPEGEQLTYFNLQRCIKHHFPKSAAALAVLSVAEAAAAAK